MFHFVLSPYINCSITIIIIILYLTVKSCSFTIMFYKQVNNYYTLLCLYILLSNSLLLNNSDLKKYPPINMKDGNCSKASSWTPDFSSFFSALHLKWLVCLHCTNLDTKNKYISSLWNRYYISIKSENRIWLFHFQFYSTNPEFIYFHKTMQEMLDINCRYFYL